MDIVIAGGQDPDELAGVRLLWREYWDSAGLDPLFQGFATELNSLPGRYAPPSGCLLLARTPGSGVPAGTAALRPLDSPGDCEAKRLYVTPRFRGQGLGAALLERLIREARARGYSRMFGDTLPAMAGALAMYRRRGFVEVPPYASEPTPGAIYLRLTL